jgi:iron complex outermembrane recepter protein
MQVREFLPSLCAAIFAIAPFGAAAQQTLLGEGAGTAGPPVALPTLEVAGGRPRETGFVATDSGTGTKTDTPIREIPQSISVVPREAIDARQAQNLSEALRYSAGIRPEAFGPDTRLDWLLIRGFEATETGLFLDGLRFNPAYAGNSFETYGLSRYEILRGPGSVLYGQMAPGGIINFASRVPPEPQGEVHKQRAAHPGRRVVVQSDRPRPAVGHPGAIRRRRPGLRRPRDHLASGRRHCRDDPGLLPA